MDTVHQEPLRTVAGRRRLGALVAAALAVLLIAAAPAAGAAPRDGWGFAIADDDWEWDNPGYLPSLGDGFADLAPKAFRLQMIWNAADKEWHMDRARAMIARARAQGVQQIVVTFKKSVGQDMDPEGPQPSADNYGAHVGEVMRQLAGDVDVWGPANEPNLGEMWLPRAEGARLLAEYYKRLEVAAEAWDPTAEITSPDFVDRTDLATIGRYVNAYENAGGGWGDHVAFHPYWGAHAETTQTTLDLIGLAPPGADVWITEVGAFGRSESAGIEATETAQNDKVWWLAETLAALPQVQRIHYYHMRGSPTATWDTGLMDIDANPRIAWHTWCAMSRGLDHPECQPVTPRTPPPPPDPPPADDPPPGGTSPPPPPPTLSLASAPTPTITDAPPVAVDCPSPTLLLSGCPAPGTSPPPDGVPPTLTIDRLAGRMTYASFIDGIAPRVRASEPSALDVSLAVKARRRPDSSPGYAVVARRAVEAKGGARRVRLQPRRRPLAGKRRFVARVRIRATDRSGNHSTFSKALRVRPR